MLILVILNHMSHKESLYWKDITTFSKASQQCQERRKFFEDYQIYGSTSYAHFQYSIPRKHTENLQPLLPTCEKRLKKRLHKFSFSWIYPLWPKFREFKSILKRLFDAVVSIKFFAFSSSRHTSGFKILKTINSLQNTLVNPIS